MKYFLIICSTKKLKEIFRYQRYQSLMLQIGAHYQINLCQNWTILIRTIQNAIGTRHFNIGTVRTVSDTFPQNF